MIADVGLYINARFATAYTSGIYVDPTTSAVMKMRPKGTWMVDIAVMVGFGSPMNTIAVSTEAPEDISVCELKPEDCFFRGEGGRVMVNDEPMLQIGNVVLGRQPWDCVRASQCCR